VPLLTGPSADAARAVVADVAAALRDPAVHDADPGLASSDVGRGSAGAALFFHELARAGGDENDQETAYAFLDTALAGAVEERPTAPLYSGTTGVGYALAHLQDHDDDTNDVDELALAALGSDAWPSPDLIRGVTGVGVYLLERLPAPVARKGLDAVVDRLTRMSETDGDGITWYVDPRTVLEDRRQLFPDGYYDVGMAHGQAGMVALLGLMVSAGVETARPLLEGSTAWLLARRLPEDAGPGRYPLMVDKRPAPPRGGRLAWCYGDAGVAVALLAAGRALGDEAIVTEAVDLAVLSAGRVTDAAVGDAPLCHGSAGLLHVFHRLWQQTGDERLADAARRWFEVLMTQRRPGEPVAGFGSVRPKDANPASPAEYEPLAGFLEGATGIGLALLAATEGSDTGWDALLLTSPAESRA
jgi:lantibiotic modifying enzyme